MKKLALRLIYWTGFIRLWVYWHKNEVIILMVHGVMSDSSSTQWTPLRPQLAPQQLESTLKVLSRYYNFISLQEAVDMLTGIKPFQPYSLAVTFDDGYRNNIKFALPILKKYNVPPTIFLSAAHVEYREPFWFDRLDYALQQVKSSKLDVKVGGEIVRIDYNSRNSLRRSYKRLRYVAKAVKRHDDEMLSEMEGIASKIEEESGKSLMGIFENDDWSAVLTWGEIEATAKKGVSFASHGWNHTRLGFLDAGESRRQMSMSKERIIAHTGQPCNHFCYPDGSFNQQVIQFAHELGYESASTTLTGTNRKGDDPMQLRRIPFPEGASAPEAICRVSGLVSAIFSLKKRVKEVWL